MRELVQPWGQMMTALRFPLLDNAWCLVIVAIFIGFGGAGVKRCGGRFVVAIQAIRAKQFLWQKGVLTM